MAARILRKLKNDSNILANSIQRDLVGDWKKHVIVRFNIHNQTVYTVLQKPFRFKVRTYESHNNILKLNFFLKVNIFT